MAQEMKYRSTRVDAPDGRFDSKHELRAYRALQLREQAGEISDLARQVTFELAPTVKIDGRKRPPVRYIADFVYRENGAQVVADAKGMRTPVYKLKRHLMMTVHGIPILEL